jgi:hypothetical protein
MERHLWPRASVIAETHRLKRASRASDIIIANDADHTRFRKALAHGFSEKAMHQQEALVKVYIDLLIEKLRDVAT